MFHGRNAQVSTAGIPVRPRERARCEDGSKVGHRAFARIREPEEIDVLVTDAAAPEPELAAFAEAGVRVIRA
ncbi:hypothetical protein [Actinomadura sp. K4S16]|uniref:hypothetical protein n=1 Tax=Actinomadura sp. K4S16 TaxID=1316147 RepID=UPI0011EC0EF8|nr:hypothetical protein [Actinomadura sp. K4S16]